MIHLIAKWHLKRKRKKIFYAVTNLAQDILNKFNQVKNLYPNAPRKKLYKLTLNLYPYNEEDIYKILEDAMSYSPDKLLRLINIAQIIVMEGISETYDLYVKNPTKERYSITKDPKDWEIYSSYYEIIAKVIPEYI